MDVNGPQYQAILRERQMHRRYGADFREVIWAQATLERLEKKSPCFGYTDKDRKDFEKAKKISERIFAKADVQGHVTTHYIWRTQGDGKVRPEHAANNGKIFAWNDAPSTGHPGEDFHCRCWAEPYAEKLEERAVQFVTNPVHDASPVWTRKEFLDYYRAESRKKRGDAARSDTVTLSRIGHLQRIIDAAKTYVQEGDRSTFSRVARDVFEKARDSGISRPYRFRNSYEFGFFVWEIGGGTVEGSGLIHVSEKEDFLIVSADINYEFSDVFTDPYDIYDLIYGEFNPDGIPYNIKDSWSTRLEAIIKKDSSQSKFPNN